MANFNRLRQIVTHLRSGNLAHDTFDFNQYNAGPFEPNGCGTNGCAVGEFPAIWPDFWAWGTGESEGALIRRATGETPLYWDAAQDFLSIKRDVRQFLFSPDSPDNPNGLPGTATAPEVADHIETWCDENEKP